MDIKNIFGKVQNLRNLIDSEDGEELLDNAVSEDDYEPSKKPRRTAKGIFSNDEESNIADFSASYNYSPTAALPKFGSDFSDDFPPIKGIDGDINPSENTTASNLFDIKSAPKQSTSKYKLSFLSIQDWYDVKNVANLMIDKKTIIIVNLALLREDYVRRAMDFLDGVKYVSKSVYVNFSDTICAFIPEDIELHGDFYNQVEL